MNTISEEFKSPWGFHPCDDQLFRRLRLLHGWYWQTVYDFHCWHRWWRKEPQNREGAEPKFCPAFVQDSVWYKPVLFHGEPGHKVYPKTVVDHGIVDLYQSARLPQAEPVVPFDAETIERIESLYSKVAAYFEK